MIKKLMKRTISLVLALLMVLSIWPMSALATEAPDPTGEQGGDTPTPISDPTVYTHSGDPFSAMGVYHFTQLVDDGDANNGTTPTILSYNGEGRQWYNGVNECITFSYPGKTETQTVYLAVHSDQSLSTEGATLTELGVWAKPFTNPEGEQEFEHLKLYSLSAAKPQNGFEAKINATRSWTEMNEGVSTPRSESFTYIFDYAPVYTSDGEPKWERGVGFFTSFDTTTGFSKDNTVSGYEDGAMVSCYFGESKTIYMTCNKSIEVTGATLTEIGKWQFADNETWPVFSMTVTNFENKEFLEYDIACGNDQPFKLKFVFEEKIVANPSNKVPEDAVLASEDGISYDFVPIGNTGYYVTPIFDMGGSLVEMGESRGPVFESGWHEDYIAVGLYKKIEGSEKLELLYGNELATVKNNFETLTMEVFWLDDGNPRPEMPRVKPLTDAPDPCAALYGFNYLTQGDWIFKVTGTYDDGVTKTDITAYGKSIRRLTDVYGIDMLSNETVAGINEKILGLVEYWKTTEEAAQGKELSIVINLPAEEIHGYFEVPADVGEVTFFGKTDANHNILTILNGGIVSNSTISKACDIQFRGAGKNVPTVTADDGTTYPNSAMAGFAGGSVLHCSLTDYYYAIYRQGGNIGAADDENVDGTGSFFYNNHVGIMNDIDDPDYIWGQPWIRNTVMVNNDIDIHLKDIADSPYGVGYEFISCIIVRDDNNNSIRNTMGTTEYLPLLTFAGSHHNYKEPKVDGNVSIPPYYGLSEKGKDALITNFNPAAMLANPCYDPDWVEDVRLFPKNWKCPVEGDEDLYKVPVSQVDSDGMTIGMMDGEEVCANIKLKKN